MIQPLLAGDRRMSLWPNCACKTRARAGFGRGPDCFAFVVPDTLNLNPFAEN